MSYFTSAHSKAINFLAQRESACDSGVTERSLNSRFLPVAVDLVDACGSILAPVLYAVVDVDEAVMARPPRRADTTVAGGVVKNAPAAIGTGLSE